MFRVVVIVGIAAAPVIVLGLIYRPEWAAILLALEIGVGIWLLWRSPRGTEPHTAEVADAATASTGCSWSPTRRSPAERCSTRSAAAARAVPTARSSSWSRRFPLAARASRPRRRRRDRRGPRAARPLARGDGGGRPQRARGGRRPPRPERRDRGRPARLRRRRGDRLDPPAGALEVARARGGRAGASARSRCRSPTWSSTSRPRAAPAPRPGAPSARAADVLEQVVDQALEVLRGQRALEVLRHHVRPEALGDLGVRVDDRLLDVLRRPCRLAPRRGSGPWSPGVPAACSVWQLPHFCGEQLGRAAAAAASRPGRRRRWRRRRRRPRRPGR